MSIVEKALQVGLLCFMTCSIASASQSSTKTKQPPAIFDIFSLANKIPNLPSGGGKFQSVPSEVAKEIEKNRESILKSAKKIFSHDNALVLKNVDDTGEDYILLLFGKDGKLISAVRDYEKWSICKDWKAAGNLILAHCDGAEGGQDWSFDISYDLKAKTGKISNQINHDET